MNARPLTRLPLSILLLPTLQACGGGADARPSLDFGGEVREVASPALQGSGEPNLFAAADGRVHLSWFDPAEEPREHVLRFATFAPADVERGEVDWSDPREIARGGNFFVNWADFPSIHELPDGTLGAHWLVRSGPDSYEYEVHLGWSDDAGESWQGPVVPHRDGTLSEHGFVSLLPREDAFGVVWLDGREFERSPEDPHMTLRFTTFAPGGEAVAAAPVHQGVETASGEAEPSGEAGRDPQESGNEAALGEEVLLDGRVCDCCQTSAAVTEEGPVVVYRDRTEEEIRDISIVRLEEEGWSDPVPVHRDGWEIPACPVNGPMVAAGGRTVAVAWFTAAEEEPRVLLAFSEDAGRSFGTPIEIDDGNPIGRVAVVLDEESRAVVSWLERTGEGAEVRVRRADRSGARGEALTVASASAARAGGFPRMVRSGELLVFAWNDVDGSGRVEVRVLALDEA